MLRTRRDMRPVKGMALTMYNMFDQWRFYCEAIVIKGIIKIDFLFIA